MLQRLPFIPYLFAFFAFTLFWVAGAMAQSKTLEVTVDGFKDGAVIPQEYAFCVPDGKGKSADGKNISPSISWSEGPKGTQSYAIIVHDEDVPTVFDDANKDGRTISASLARMDFYHWVLVDIPSSITSLKKGQDSAELAKTGKPVSKQPYGLRGKNDYGTFMEGVFGGYDGPCPPWNDEIPHHYHFSVYALDVPTLGLSGEFTGAEAKQAMVGHILAKGEVIGVYSQNPKVKLP